MPQETPSLPADTYQSMIERGRNHCPLLAYEIAEFPRRPTIWSALVRLLTGPPHAH